MRQHSSNYRHLFHIELVTTRVPPPETSRKRQRDTEEKDFNLRRKPHRMDLPASLVAKYEEADRIYRKEHGLPPAETRSNPPGCGISTTRIRAICEAKQQLFSTHTALSAFRQLAAVWHGSSADAKWAPLWTLTPSDRVTAFKEMATEGEWKVSTQVTHWEAICTTGSALSDALRNNPAATDNRMLKVLRAAHRSAPPPPLVILTPPEAALSVARLQYRGQTAEATLLRTTYSTLSRLPDVAGLATTHLFRVHSTCAALLMNKTKTSNKVGAHCVHVDGELAQELFHLATIRRATQQDYLWDPQCKQRIVNALPEGRGALSIRKGAAIAASLAGGPTPAISQQMAHTTIQRTLYYLHSGVYNVEGQRRSTGLQHLIEIATHEALRQTL